MFKIVSAFLALAFVAGILANGDEECELNEDTCGIDYLYGFLNLQLLSARTELEEECQLALETLDCYTEKTKMCDVPTKDTDLQRLANLRLFLQYTCSPGEFNYTIPPPADCVTDFHHCLVDVASYVKHDTILPDGEHLDQNCPLIASIVTCVDDNFRTCVSPHQDIFKLNLTDEIFTSLCDKTSALNKLYKEIVDCINGLKEEFVSALNSIEVVTHDFIIYLKEKDVSRSSAIRAAICTFTDLIAVKIPLLLKNNCSPAAGSLTEHLMSTFVKICPAKYFGNELEELTSNFMDFMSSYISSRDEHYRRHVESAN